MSSSKVAKTFIEDWVFNYGPPKELIANNRKCFTAQFIQEVCRILNIYNSFTMTYHSHRNEQVEWFDRIFKAALHSYVDEHPTY